MRDWSPERVARGRGGDARDAAAPGAQRRRPAARAVIDSRQAGPGDLFVGPARRARRRRPLRRRRAAGRRVGRAGRRERWAGVEARRPAGRGPRRADDPLAALQRLATAWRRELGAQVSAITGSTGKTSTKDLLGGDARARSAASSPRALNLNTEIGLPLTVLGAPAGTEVLVLEMAMRGAGQIAELAAIAEPDVGVIVNVGPVHLELLGTIEAIAADEGRAARGAARPGGTAIVPGRRAAAGRPPARRA